MSSAGAVDEVVLPRRVIPQPTPGVVDQGDCGACVLGGLLGIPIESVYDDLVGKRHALTVDEMARVLRVASYGSLVDRVVTEFAQWPLSGHPDRTFGRPAWREALPWFVYVRMAIDAGYYGVTIINTDGDKTMGNHWVLICGARNRGPAAYDNTLTGEVLVSDSRRSVGGVDEWIEAGEFLKNRGGYEVMLARPVVPTP